MEASAPLSRHGLALLSGLVAAAGGALGKVSVDKSNRIIAAIHDQCHAPKADGAVTTCMVVVLGARAVALTLMLAFNALMVSLFVRSLHRSGTTIATVLNTASNFLVSALIGWAVFGESLTLQWFCGASLIVAGVLIVGGAAAHPEDRHKAKDE